MPLVAFNFKTYKTLKYPVENGMMKHIEIPYHRKGTKIL